MKWNDALAVFACGSGIGAGGFCNASPPATAPVGLSLSAIIFVGSALGDTTVSSLSLGDCGFIPCPNVFARDLPPTANMSGVGDGGSDTSSVGSSGDAAGDPVSPTEARSALPARRRGCASGGKCGVGGGDDDG